MSDQSTLPITFRLAASADALCIAVLGMQVFLDTYATEGIRDALAREAVASFDSAMLSSLIARPDTFFIVAESNGHLLGFAQFILRTDHPMVLDPSAAELQRLYVQERFTGSGIGWQLLRFTEQQARSKGASGLWATVWAGNQRALDFYVNQRYEHVGSPVYALQDELHENLLFYKSL